MKIATILAKGIICYLLYMPFGIVFLPFCALKFICDAIYYVNEKLLDFLFDVFGLEEYS